MGELNYNDRLRASDYVVLPVDFITAKTIIKNFHYAGGGSNTAVYTHGLFKKGEELFEASCLGVAWWIPAPTRSAAEATYPEGDWKKVLCLHRLAIAPQVPKNACSFLLSRSMKMVDRQKWECLVTYADTWRDHHGTIYKATNWEYMGLTEPQPVMVRQKGNLMMGRKRGPKSLTMKEMRAAGFVSQGNHAKHKFRFILK